MMSFLCRDLDETLIVFASLVDFERLDGRFKKYNWVSSMPT